MYYMVRSRPYREQVRLRLGDGGRGARASADVRRLHDRPLDVVLLGEGVQFEDHRAVVTVRYETDTDRVLLHT